jgi:predicted TIM-barrel fold metal-dependent hydrolase
MSQPNGLKALDADGVDAEVLVPNDPASFHQYEDAEFELECVRAYNDSVSEWHKSSDRFIPLAMEAVVAEVERAAANGHRGIVMFALPSLLVERLLHISESYWYPLWDACQNLNMPIHFHASEML